MNSYQIIHSVYASNKTQRVLIKLDNFLTSLQILQWLPTTIRIQLQLLARTIRPYSIYPLPTSPTSMPTTDGCSHSGVNTPSLFSPQGLGLCALPRSVHGCCSHSIPVSPLLGTAFPDPSAKVAPLLTLFTQLSSSLLHLTLLGILLGKWVFSYCLSPH